jgi:hypothetical protein
MNEERISCSMAIGVMLVAVAGSDIAGFSG